MSNGEDSEFWNQVLQRFTAAKLKVAQLTTELNEVTQERDRLKRELELEKPEVKVKAEPAQRQCRMEGPSTSIQHQDCVDARKLQELEDGISKAQDSYHKIEQKLRDNASMIQDLLDNNQRMRAERDAMQVQRDEFKEALRQAQSDLDKARLERQVLSSQLPPIFNSPGKSTYITESALQHEIQDVYQPKVASLEREIEELRNANSKLRNERDVFKDELESVRTKLEKAKLSKSSLSDQLRDLDIQARGGLRSRTSSIRIGGSQAGGLSSPHSTLSSVLHSEHQPLRTLPKIPSAAVLYDLTAEDKASEDNAPTPRPASSPVLSLPASRQKEISRFPLVLPSVAVKDSENAFSRDFMTTVLGGSIQPLIVRVSKQGKISKKRDLNGYLCPGLDHNPWCPSIPGQHGYIFVGLGREKDTFRVPEEHNVFVGLKKKSKETRRFRYLGKYQAKRVDSLSRNEWLSLPATMRTTYAKTTKEKTKDTRSVEAILKAYDDGELSVPCVQLQCIGFDAELYQAMVTEYAKNTMRTTIACHALANVLP
ncbi:hypothetical protein H1R20_g8267, partial [Candolleomyces eurysporus]